jgi:GNAT superfamily N-acetyltransferase
LFTMGWLSMTIALRAAREDDLPALWDVEYQNEIRGLSERPPRGDVPPSLHHIWATGTTRLAEDAGQILAFGAAIRRGDVTFLTDLFVVPGVQSRGLGGAVLAEVLAHSGGSVRCTMSSTDPRAHALYIRAGMAPQWPHYCLRATTPTPIAMPAALTVEPTAATDAAFLGWDAAIGGRQRPEDMAFWARAEGGAALWFQRAGTTIGYGVVRQQAWSFTGGRTCTIGPLGVRDPADASASVRAAIAWAQSRVSQVQINLPGGHPALADLLANGFHIAYVETFHSDAAPFFDPHCAITSGSGLL